MRLRLRPLVAAGALLGLPTTLYAQNELSNFSATGRGGVINTFARDYQAIGINPANLGREGEYTAAFTIGELGAGIASQSISKTLFKHMLYDSDQPISAAEKMQLVKDLTSENALNLNVDVTSIGLSFTLPNGLGGLAFSNRQRLAGHLALNNNAADIIVNGQNAAVIKQYYPNPSTNGSPTPTAPNAPFVSEALDGSAIQLAWTSEYNVSYGVRVLDKEGLKVTAGVGYRYIQGIGIADIRVKTGELEAYSALSPIFQVNYGNLATSPNFNLETGGGLHPVGSGNGFDLGLAAEIGKIVRVGASITDMGSMTWTGNVLTATDQRLQYTDSKGIQTYNVFEELSNQFGTEDASLFTYQAAKERKADLPTKLRLGAGFRISELFEAGLDVTAPLNKVAGNLTSTFVGVGVDFKPARWVRLSTGVSGGAGYGASLPLGVTFISPVWEAGISSRDISGYFNEKSPYTSLSFGFLRFKLGVKS